VPAKAVQHVDRAVLAAEDHELLTECVDLMGITVTEVADQAQAMPPAGESGWRGLGLDEAYFVGLGLHSHT
jgi:hypothetical protein